MHRASESIQARDEATLDLLWLEPTVEGTAPRTHLDGTRTRLQNEGIIPRLVATSDEPTPRMTQKIRRLARLVRTVRGLRPKGVLLARWHPFLSLVSPNWRRDGGRVVLLVQGNDESLYETYPWFRRIPFARRLVRSSLRAADEVLVLNEGLRTWVESVCGSEGITMLPSGVADVFLNAQAPPDRANDRPYILFFGNLATWQGIAYLLEAKARKEWPASVDLVVVGAGDDGPLVERAAEEDPSIRYLGRLAQTELAPLVAGALATACTKRATGSMAETTTPFKMLESAAAGVPVIATDIPAQRKLIETDGYGILTQPDDPGSFAIAVAAIHDDASLRRRLVDAALLTRSRLGWGDSSSIVAEAIGRAGQRVDVR